MIKSLKALQDVLGRHQDREVQQALIRELAGDVDAQPGGADGLMAMGALLAHSEPTSAPPARSSPRCSRRSRPRAPAGGEAHVPGRGAAMTTVLATYNIKGGVGKTSAAVNLAYLAARDGARTLLWDLDPQGAATYLFRIRPKVRGGGRRLLSLKSRADRLIKETDYEGLDVLPADFSYRHMDLALDRYKRPTRRLSRVLAPMAGDYDVIVLDCPPSISLVSESVFEAADALLVPVIPAALPVRTFEQLAGLIRADGPRLLAFLSMLDISRPLHRELMARLRREHPDEMLGVAIPYSEDVERMGSERTAITEFAPGSPAAQAYRALWWDIRRRLGRRLR